MLQQTQFILFPDFIHTIPASYRHMDGFGSHTEEAEVLVGKDPDSHQRELREAIERGEFPSLTVGVQIMPAAQAGTYRFNPFDLTKVWPHADYRSSRSAGWS